MENRNRDVIMLNYVYTLIIEF